MVYIHQPNKVFRYFELSISDKKMAKIMFALLKTRSKLINSYHHSIRHYSRQQCGGFLVAVVIEIDESNIVLFEELGEVELKTSNEFQGKLKLNNNELIQHD